jgi:hypothetical protein
MTPSDTDNAQRNAQRPSPPARGPASGLSGFLSAQVKALAWIGIAVLLLGMASVPWLLSDPARISRLIARSAPQLQGDVTFQRVSIGWLGPIVLEDVRIVPRNPRPETPEAAGSAAAVPAARGEPIRIRRIEGSHGLAGMLLSFGDLGRFRVEGLEVDVVFDADRQSNLKALFPQPPDAGSPGEARELRRSPVRMRLEVEDAIVRISGPWADDTWISDPIDVRATLARSPSGSHSEWSIEPVQLLKDARLEPSVAQGVLAYIAPVMADAARTSGRFSLRLDGAALPVGQPGSGNLSGVLSMHEVDLGPGPLVKNMLASLPGRLQLPQSIRIADDSNVEFRLADRRVWHKGLEFGLPLAQPGQRLDVESSGSVGLDDRSLDLKLALPIPADLPQDRPLIAALSGKTFSIGIGGVLGEPRVQFDGSLRASAGEVVVDLIDRLRGGRPTRPAPVPVPQLRPAGPPEPEWRPNSAATARKDGQAVGDQDAKQAADKQQADKPSADNRQAEKPAADERDGTAATLEKLKSKLPPEIGKDPAADAVIDLVGGVLEEVAKRRAERQAAEAANPQQPPPRRGRLLRRLAPPPEQPPPQQ